MTNELLNKLGTVIKEARIASGLSQEELGYRTNLHRTYIGSVERGERNISINNLFKITKALDIQLSELLKDIK